MLRRPRPSARLRAAWLLGAIAALPAAAHLPEGHRAETYAVAPPRGTGAGEHVLQLAIVDAATGEPTAARFTLTLDGELHVPSGLGPHGLHFTTHQNRRRQRFIATYSRGTGIVEVPLPPAALGGQVEVVKGFEFLAERRRFVVRDGRAEITVALERWSDVGSAGWVAADEHLHYDRLAASRDPDWLTLLAGDDLEVGHFLIARGGNQRGTWAKQYAFGPAGEAADGERSIRSGEEYRDAAQGHINLLGIAEEIWPMASGDFDVLGSPFHSPPFHDVMLEARRQGGLAGVAHGGAYGVAVTAVLDSVLGAADFFELANTHLVHLSQWYQLANAGFVLPPAAGTDLPNFPHRQPWQPLLGEARMYVRTGGAVDFESWRQVLGRGEVWVTTGPMLSFTVDGVGPGGTVRLPPRGGTVEVIAELASPRALRSLEIVHNGEPVAAATQEAIGGDIHRLTLRQRLRIEDSAWLAARGEGGWKRALREESRIDQRTFAHSAAVRVLVGERPIHSRKDLAALQAQLATGRGFYAEQGKFERPEDRDHFLALFDRADGVLAERLALPAHTRRLRLAPAALLAAALLTSGVVVATILARRRRYRPRAVGGTLP